MQMKRVFDITMGVILLVILIPIFITLWIISAINTLSSGIFLQERIGQYGNTFTIIKFRTMDVKSHKTSMVGRFMRRCKFDELPQLINIVKGDMSFVGPRPDVPGYYDRLQGDDRKILNLKPGLTSPAALYYFNEEQILAEQDDPKWYNDHVIFPHKVKMGLEYYYNSSFFGDLAVLFRTVLSFVKKVRQ
jgi:lipopolysaccharide/colanic/teichoic acid biosynthesis glycosyltransferase